MKTRKAIVFAGTRGVPANYGGFETAVDEISAGFVKRGYDCVVFCRRSSCGELPEHHKGRELVYVEGSPKRSLDTFVSAFQTGWHLLRHRQDCDHVFWFNNANLPGILLTLLSRTPMSVNTDGLEWRRAKWSWPFKAYYFFSSFLVSLLCRSVISDSKAIQDYYKKTFSKNTQFIPYGIPEAPEASAERSASILDRYGLEANRYFLQVTRFEPDNLPLDIAEAFRASGLAREGFKLLLVGYQHETAYARQVKALSGESGIVVVDAMYDAEILVALRSNCFCYLHGNLVGGTNPALLEAMASCPRVLAIDVPFSRELLGDTGYFFTRESIVSSLREAGKYPDRYADMSKRVRARYDWEAVAESYARLAEGKSADYELF